MDDRLPDDSVGGADRRSPTSPERALGDFTATWETALLVPMALAVGLVSAVVALALLDLIGFITQGVYYHHLGLGLVSPRANTLGAIAVAIPVAGGLVVGAMARWGSERIRGHGIPEAMETILVGGSKMEPRLTVLKPISSAISIGTGGPFGAEGPIILTGGAIGSVLGQLFRLSAIERRTLLVAGACGGMTAVFGTPVAAALFGVELLLFEWKPRSMVPVALAVAAAETLRNVLAHLHLLQAAPLFPIPAHAAFATLGVAEAAVIGVGGGLLAWVLTTACYGAEDAFKKLPVHWAWWPAIGGAVVGLGGLVDPRALGVGYDTIGAELAGHLAVGALLSLLVVKLVVWSVALGSGTSGGILAPLLMMGAAMGGLVGSVLPGGSIATWALMGMGATLAGVTRSPFTAIVFAFELTHDTGSLLPLLLACTLAHFVSVVTLRRSILTEKVARRGFHVMREYVVEPLEALFVREAMMTEVLTVEPTRPVAAFRATLESSPVSRRQRLYPVVGEHGAMIGVIGWSDLFVRAEAGTSAGGAEGAGDPEVGAEAEAGAEIGAGTGLAVVDVMQTGAVVAYPDETCRSAADRMADHQVGVLPVVRREDPSQLCGILTQFDLLGARQRQLEEERHRQRVLHLGPVWPTRRSRAASPR